MSFIFFILGCKNNQNCDGCPLFEDAKIIKVAVGVLYLLSHKGLLKKISL